MMSADSPEPPPSPHPPSPPEPSSSPAMRPSRPRRILKWSLVALGLAVLFVAALPLLLSTSFVRAAIQSWLEDNVDRKVEFARLDVTYLHGIRLEGLKVSDKVRGRPLLEAPLVELDVPYLPLLAKKFLVRKFAITDPVLHVAALSETESNVDDVVKTRKVRKRRDGADAADEHVLPEVHVPVTVRNLTVVFTDRQGREARQAGIDFDGLVNTREGPTTFELSVPCGANGGGLSAKGDLALLDPDGTLLPRAERKIDVTVTLTRIDARTNRDFLALVFGTTPVAGVLDGKVDVHTVGREINGSVDLRLAELGFGGATEGAQRRGKEDLVVAGKFALSRESLRLTGWTARAEGLSIDADVSGGFDALEGSAKVDCDLARMAGALRAIGAEVPQLAGRIAGSAQFTRSPSKGTGEFALSGLRAQFGDRPPVSIESGALQFEVIPSKDRFELTRLEARLAEVTAHAHGSRAADGTIDLAADASGDLGALLDRVRDLGFLPSQFSVNGRVEAQAHLAGKSDALTVEVQKLSLTETDVRISATGTRTADGSLDFRASGEGDLGKLFGRAHAAGAGPQGIENLRGRFAFDATAKGPPTALAVDVPKLVVEGDLSVRAHATMAPDGRIDAAVEDVSGEVDDILLLLRRTGVLDREFKVGGRIAATASVKGTRSAPEVPRFAAKMTGGPLALDAEGSLAADGSVAATVRATADLAAVADLLQRTGATATRPPLAGRLAAHATLGGRRDRVEVPEFVVTVADGPVDGEVRGSYGADGRLAATADVKGDLDRLLRFAQERGLTKRVPSPLGTSYALHAVAAGPRDAIEITTAKFSTVGPLQIAADGAMRADRSYTASGRVSGALQPILDLGSAWSGEAPRRIEGTVDGTFEIAGTGGEFSAKLPQLAIRTRGLALDASGSRAADGATQGTFKAAGPLEDLVALAKAFGTDVEASGRIDAQGALTMQGERSEGSLHLVATDLVVTKPEIGGGPFREPRLALDVPAVRFDPTTKALEPVKVHATMVGAEFDATIRKTGDVVSVTDGSLRADETFSKNHVDLFSGATFHAIDGKFSFEGDVGNRTETASKWTGAFDLNATDFDAPHVSVAHANLPGRIEGGFAVIDPVTATVNGGTVRGNARIGLAGAEPAHHLVFVAKDVELDEDLAPLIAHASPLFAVGENGKAGGKASIDADLTARGTTSATIKKTLQGNGVLAIDGGYVESTNWIGELLDLLGAGGRLDIASTKVDFRVKDGQVETTELPVDAMGLLIRLGGVVGLDGKLDYGLRVKPRSGAALSGIAQYLDKEGYIPLRLEGTVKKPKLKLPDLKDVLRDRLGDLLGGHRRDDKEPPPGTDPPKKRKKKKAPEPAPPPPPADGTPPPPPAPGDAKDVVPPPPPPPPPPADEKKDDPPPPPPPK